jgi:nitroreductase
MFDCGLITGTMCLAAAALGLGTVIIGLADSAKMGEVLGVPSGFTAVCLVPVGYPDDAVSPKRTARRELAEFVFRNRYGVQ